MSQIFRLARPLALPLTLAASVLALNACSGTGDEVARSVGLIREAPDEFIVTTRAPLVIPPNLNALPAPTPGVARPQERSSREAALLTLAPQTVAASSTSAAPSKGEKALVKAAPQPADKNVRADIDQIANQDAKGDFGDKVKFWKDKPAAGVAVDAQGESQRLRQNAALGRSVTDGNTPVEQPSSAPNMIERAFNKTGDKGEMAPGAEPPKSKAWYDLF